MITMAEFTKRKREHEEGFTLLEVMISVVILAVGLLAVAQMQIISVRSNYSGRDVTEATSLAKDHLEYLKSLPYDHADLNDTDASNNGNLLNTGTVDHADPNNPVDARGAGGVRGARYTRIWNVAEGVPDSETKTVAVVASWQEGPNAATRQVQVSTIISNPDP